MPLLLTVYSSARHGLAEDQHIRRYAKESAQMTTEQVAAKLNCDVAHVRRLLRNKKIIGERKVAKYGVEWIIDGHSVTRYLKASNSLAAKGKKRGWKRGRPRTEHIA